MQGVIKGVQYCQIERTEQVNNRIYSRNLASGPLQPQFSMRPVSTKYDLMMIGDRRIPSTEPVMRTKTFDVATTFNPGTAQAPWSGFSSKINTESTLRNQFFALQKCEQREYVPSSASDLYSVTVEGRQEPTTHPALFVEPAFDNFNPNCLNTGYQNFGNCTRQQIKNTI